MDPHRNHDNHPDRDINPAHDNDNGTDSDISNRPGRMEYAGGG